MTKYPATRYIERNDFEGAFERYEATTRQYKDHWYETCVTIFNKSAKWINDYIIDPINRVIKKVVETLQNKYYRARYSHCVYLIKMYDSDNNFAYVKIGKTSKLNQRMSKLSDTFYKDEHIQISDTELVNIWTLPSEDLALSFESIVRHKIRALYPNIKYIPNDRFENNLNLDEISSKIDEFYNDFIAFVTR